MYGAVRGRAKSDMTVSSNRTELLWDSSGP